MLANWKIWFAYASLLLFAGCANARGTVPLEIGNNTLHVEVVTTPADMARGLMYRKSMPSSHGMLFVYDHPQQVYYWMKNTFIPLSIAFIDAHARIINMRDMAPNNSSRTYPSRGLCKYVLEVNQGWFKKHDIKEGDTVKFDLSQLDKP